MIRHMRSKTGIIHQHKMCFLVTFSSHESRAYRKKKCLYQVEILLFSILKKIQPAHVQAKQCAAVHTRPTLLPQWIMVPCGKTIPGASFVCEIKTNNSEQLMNRERSIFRASRECPRKKINVEFSCLHIINSLSRTDSMDKN